MQLIAYLALLASLLIFLVSSIMSLIKAWKGRKAETALVEKGQLLATALITFSSGILFNALGKRDFSFLYVVEYSDTFLPLFYAYTAFWAGQAGSLLFWTWMIALAGSVWIFTASYRNLSSPAKIAFWLFFMAVQAFFTMLLTGPSNPFMQADPPPAQGQGLNPLLQHPGMIFHPPLLFLGYAGLTIPACLAFASIVSGSSAVSWIKSSRPFTIISWIFLTAGIVLGGWWSYMELGWGGYWAWDPVENASLIPWLTATAFLHTSIVGRKRGSLMKTNVFLIGLTLILCFFGTYIVRSGVIQSLHAFGDSGVGKPLLIFIFFCLAVLLLVTFAMKNSAFRPLGGLMTRQGFLTIVSWLFLALALVVFLGTMWPLISTIGGGKSVGLQPEFYNRACLPIFTLISVMLCVCPWLDWKEWKSVPKGFYAVLGTVIAVAAGLSLTGIHQPLPLVAVSTAVAAIAGTILLFVLSPAQRKLMSTWGAYGTHIGLAITVIGVAISGPYQIEKEAVLKPGDGITIKDYSITYKRFKEAETQAMIAYGAELEVTKNGVIIGVLNPEKRLYSNNPQTFAEADTIPSLGDELYASLLGFSEDKTVSIKVSTHPLVNWIWIGTTLMCLVGFLCLYTGRRPVNTPAGAETPDTE